MDPASAAAGAVAGAAARAAAKAMTGGEGSGALVQRLFGPLFDEIGASWAERYSQSRATQLEAIIEVAARRLGTDVYGAANPRVAQSVIFDGSWTEGPLMAEYFGGILARSCAGGESNDRALRWTSLLAAMPTFDITLHYLVYDAVRRLYVGAGGDLVLDAKNYGRLRIHIPLNDLAAVFDGSLDVAQEMPQGLASLRVADLIGSWFAGPSAELEPIAGGQAVGEGLITEPTIPGLQLFLMAHGYSARDLPLLLDPAADFVATSLLPTAPGAVAVGPPAPGHSVGAEGVEPPTAAL